MAGDTPSSTHPPLPPTTEDARFDWLRLLRSRRVGPTTFHRLLAEHGSARAALAALPGVAEAAGVADYTICPEGVIHAELRAGRAAGAGLVCKGEAAYPAALARIADAPPLLWLRGRRDLLGRPMVALVGARNASSLGTRMARKLASDLADAGFVVVSGLARGIDAAAHLAALDGGTVAVMAGGVDVIYPTENTALAQDMAQRGLLLSEQPMGLEPQARHFPTRNRIIAGLAQAVVVIEAAARSGSLITAEAALVQGREVLAVPGHPFDARAGGCNQLIRDGATLVRGAEDVLAALAAQPQEQPFVLAPAAAPEPRAAALAAQPRSLREMAALHAQILSRLGPSPMAEDQLIRDLEVSATAIAPVLVDLELDGRISRQPGGLLARVM
jgi:DNA processing protein